MPALDCAAAGLAAFGCQVRAAMFSRMTTLGVFAFTYARQPSTVDFVTFFGLGVCNDILLRLQPEIAVHMPVSTQMSTVGASCIGIVCTLVKKFSGIGLCPPCFAMSQSFVLQECR